MSLSSCQADSKKCQLGNKFSQFSTMFSIPSRVCSSLTSEPNKDCIPWLATYKEHHSRGAYLIKIIPRQERVLYLRDSRDTNTLTHDREDFIHCCFSLATDGLISPQGLTTLMSTWWLSEKHNRPRDIGTRIRCCDAIHGWHGLERFRPQQHLHYILLLRPRRHLTRFGGSSAFLSGIESVSHVLQHNAQLLSVALSGSLFIYLADSYYDIGLAFKTISHSFAKYPVLLARYVIKS